MIAPLLLMLACDGDDEPAPSALSAQEAEAAAEALLEQQQQAPTPVPPSPSAPPPEAAAAPDGGVVAGAVEVEKLAQVVLIWEGIGNLYKNFFSDQDAVTSLAAGLGPHLADPVDVTVRYNAEDSVGDILIKLRPGQLTEPITATGDTIQLQGLAPVTTALATYRSTIASRFDFRVESFRVSLESYRGARVCQLTLAGKPPPDGRLISPCVTVNGQKQCGQPTEAGVTFSAAVASDIRACLDL